MSKEDNDEKRLYQCARKYEKIVKQFDELVVMMNARTKPPKRRRKVPSKSKGNTATAAAAAKPNEPDNEAFVETVSQFLKELQSETATDSDCLTGTQED